MLKNICCHHVFCTPQGTHEFYVKYTAESCYLAAHYYELKNGVFDCYHAASGFESFSEAFDNSASVSGHNQYSENLDEAAFNKVVKLRFGKFFNFQTF